MLFVTVCYPVIPYAMDTIGHREGVMAISILCPSCKSCYTVKRSKCKKCGAPAEHMVDGKARKTYRIRIQKGGRRYTATHVGNLSSAETVASKMRVNLDEDKPLDAKPAVSPTVREVYERYLSDYVRRCKAVRQLESFWRARIEEPWGDRRLSSVGSSELEDVVEKMRADGYAPKTQAHLVDFFSRLFNFAERRNLWNGPNQARAVRRPRVNNQTTRYLDEKQIAALLAVLDGWPSQIDANWVRFLLFTGARRGESFKLEWRDVDLARKLVTFRDPKGGRDVVLPMNSAAHATLKAQRAIVPKDCALVFPAEHGGIRQGGSFHKWEKIRDAAGIPSEFRLHDLRHTYASWIASSGKVDLYTLQHLLGHRESRTTARYAHLFPEQMAKGAEVFAELVKGKAKKR